MEALDVLTWAWTECLFPSHCAVPAPFTQEECRELMMLIRSFGDDHDDHGIQTRIVSKVLLKIGSNHSSLPIAPRQLFKWVIIDFFISCLFLWIPYISIAQRTCLLTRTIDEESGLRNATPSLVIGAYTCLVAWTLSRGLLAWWLSSSPRSRSERRGGNYLQAQN